VKTSYVIPNLHPRFQRNVGDVTLIAAATPSPIVETKIARARAQFMRGRIPYNAQTQPRDRTGKFRQILARLKSDLGDKELENIVAEIRNAEKADDVGDYAKASEAGRKVVSLIDDIKNGSLDQGVVKNLREGAADLGRVLAYLPLPQGQDTAKVKFSDLPPSTGRLIQGLISRVEDKVNPEDAAKFTKVLKSFISGVRTMTSDELSAEMNRLLRILT